MDSAPADMDGLPLPELRMPASATVSLGENPPTRLAASP